MHEVKPVRWSQSIKRHLLYVCYRNVASHITFHNAIRGKRKFWFSCLQCLILFPDRLGVSNPTSRDKLLTAVHELKLFGGSIPDERMFRSPRPKRRSLPARPAGMHEILLKEALSDSVEKGNSVVNIVDWCHWALGWRVFLLCSC